MQNESNEIVSLLLLSVLMFKLVNLFLILTFYIVCVGNMFV